MVKTVNISLKNSALELPTEASTSQANLRAFFLFLFPHPPFLLVTWSRHIEKMRGALGTRTVHYTTMAEGRKRRGPYLQYLSDSSSQNVPRTTKNRWNKKVRSTVDAISCESDVSGEQESDYVEWCPQGPFNVDCSFEDVDTRQDSSCCSHLLESIASSSSLDEHRLQESDAFVSTHIESDFSNCAWFSNEESIAFEEPALFTNDESKEDQTTTFADDFVEEIEIPEEEIEVTRDDSEDPLVKDTDKPLYAGARLTLGVSMLLIVTFAVRHALSGVALSDLLTLIEMHCLLPNCCANTTKLLRDFFNKLKSPIQLHYYCSFCQEYFGTEKPARCANTACLLDFTKKGSQLHYFIVIPFVNQLQAIIRGRLHKIMNGLFFPVLFS